MRTFAPNLATLLAVLGLFFSHANSSAHLKPLKKHIYLKIEAGPQWDQSLPEKRQKYMGDHIRFLKSHLKNGTFRVIASEQGHRQSFGILTLEKVAEAKALLLKDPAFQNEILKYTLTPITILFGSDEHKH